MFSRLVPAHPITYSALHKISKFIFEQTRRPRRNTPVDDYITTEIVYPKISDVSVETALILGYIIFVVFSIDRPQLSNLLIHLLLYCAAGLPFRHVTASMLT